MPTISLFFRKTILTSSLFRLIFIGYLPLLCGIAFGQNSKSLSSDARGNSKPNIIATFNGTGLQVLRPFVINGPWEIRWKTYGGDFFLDLNVNGKHVTSGLAGENEVVHVVKHPSPESITDEELSGSVPIKPGSGVVKMKQTGKLNLETSGSAKWHIEIVSDAASPITKTNQTSKVIATFSGSKTDVLGPKEYHTPFFSTSSPWEVKWSTHGNTFSLFLRNADGTENSEGGSGGSNQGQSYCSKAGKFYYVVLASEPWTITISSVK